MKNLLFLLAFFLTATLFAQAPIDFQHYEGIKCVGLIPQDFIRPTQEKYNEALEKDIEETDDNDVADAKDDFLLESNYLIDGLLQSGKVLFGDTVTKYINQVADHVLINEPALRTKLRFYCLRSPEANAFSTNQGIIFVTLGLLAQLENEAQLAFILSHEIAHYELRHVINGYLQNDEIFDKKYRHESYNDRMRIASSYSKEREMQADSLAMVRISKTIYSCNEGIEALFVTQFSDLPFEDFKFDAVLLQRDMMKFPKYIFLDSVKPINFDKDKDDDSYSSHPNMATRRKELEKVLNDQSCSGSAKFIESPAAFLTIRKIARFETIGLQLQEREYCVAYYNSYVLLKEDSTNTYLKGCIGKAIYGLAKYKNHDNYATEKFRKKEGNQQQCYYVFSRMNAAQLNLIALRYLFDISQTDSSYLIITMRNDLADEAVRLNNIHFDDLKTAAAIYKSALEKKDNNSITTDTSKVSTPTSNQNPNEYISKYDKLRIEKKKQEEAMLFSKVADQSNFHLLAFGDIMETPNVKALFNKAEITSAQRIAEDKQEERKKTEEIKLDDAAYEKIQDKEVNEIQSQKLGIDTVVFIDPYFIANDGQSPLFIASENTERELPDLLMEKAIPLKLFVSVISPKAFNENDVELYNELSLMNEWATERGLHEDFDFLCLSTDKVIPLATKYHTNHFCYIRIYGYANVSYYYTLMYDITTGFEELNYEEKKLQRAKLTLIESFFKTTMKTISKTSKKKSID